MISLNFFTNQIKMCQKNKTKKIMQLMVWHKKYGAMYYVNRKEFSVLIFRRYFENHCENFREKRSYWEWTCTFCSRLPHSPYPCRLLYLVLEQAVGNWFFSKAIVMEYQLEQKLLYIENQAIDITTPCWLVLHLYGSSSAMWHAVVKC